MYQRLSKLSQLNSFFLFGARGCGKSTLLSTLFSQTNVDYFWIDLLNLDIELQYKNDPQYLVKQYLAMEQKPLWIIIDEVQKVPRILDAVHQLIEKYKVKFALTGSSARKLKRAQANMLAGRAFNFSLFPLSFVELKNDFLLDKALSYGTLPKIFSSELKPDLEKKRFLKSYVSTYIREEIIVEQIIRKIEPFYRFLEVAAQVNGDILNYSKIAREAKVVDKSVVRYFEILSDTLMGFFLPSYHKSVRKQQIAAPRFYFFDTGVVRAIRGHINLEVTPATFDYGKLFESFFICEVYKLNSYYETDFKLSYIKTKEGQEIDLIIETPSEIFLIEVKSSKSIELEDIRPLKSLIGSFKNASGFVACQTTEAIQLTENIKSMHWKDVIYTIFKHYVI